MLTRALQAFPIPCRRPLAALGLSLSLAACAAPSALVKDGLALEQAGRYAEAVSLYRSAIDSGQATEAQLAPRLTAAAGALAASHAARGQKALRDGDLEAAFQLAGEAAKLAPDRPEVQALHKALRASQMDRAANLVAEKKSLEAIDVLNRLLAIRPDDQPAREARDDLVQAASSQLEQAIRDYDQRNLLANAFLASLALERLEPGDTALAAEIARRREGLVKRYLVPLTWEISARGSLAQTATSAMTGLKLNSPLLTFQAGGRAPEALHITLSRLDEDFVQTVEPTTRTRAVPNGTRRIPNPELAKAKERLKQLEAQISDEGDRIDRLHAQLPKLKSSADRNRVSADISELEREYHRLSTEYVEISDKAQGLPEEVEIADYQDVRYPVDLYRRAAVISFRFQALSTRADLPLKVELDLSARAEDTSEVHGAFLEYGIPATGLQFSRSDEVLRQEALRELVKVVGNTVDTLINDVMVLERTNGQALVNQGKSDEAVEKFVRVVLGTTSEPAPEIISLFKSRGVVDVPRVRGTADLGGKPSGAGEGNRQSTTAAP